MLSYNPLFKYLQAQRTGTIGLIILHQKREGKKRINRYTEEELLFILLLLINYYY